LSSTIKHATDWILTPALLSFALQTVGWPRLIFFFFHFFYIAKGYYLYFPSGGTLLNAPPFAERPLDRCFLRSVIFIWYATAFTPSLLTSMPRQNSGLGLAISDLVEQPSHFPFPTSIAVPSSLIQSFPIGAMLEFLNVKSFPAFFLFWQNADREARNRSF